MLIKNMLIFVMMISLLSIGSFSFADSTAESTVNGVQSTSNLQLDQSDHSIKTYEATDARPNSGPVPIPGSPGWFTVPTPDGDFIAIKDIIQFGSIYSKSALENMAKWGHTRVTYAMINEDKIETTHKKIMIVIDPAAIKKVAKEGTHIAFVNGSATDGKTNSIQLMAKMALKALKNGANVITFQAEGAHRKVEAFGWGIGFSYVKSGETGMGTGGTGISGGATGPEDRPWIQGNAFADVEIQKVIDNL